MGTRLFCDQCGNTVREFKIVSFGREPSPEERRKYEQQVTDYQNHMHMQRLSMYGGGPPPQVMPNMPYPSQPTEYTRIRVELCDGCLPIWLKRVESLTKESDPE